MEVCSTVVDGHDVDVWFRMAGHGVDTEVGCDAGCSPGIARVL